MSVSSLSKFTVPLASDQSASAQGLLMPKLKYRFRVSFENFGVSTPRSELTKQVVDFTRPSVTFDEIPLDIYKLYCYCLSDYIIENVPVSKINSIDFSEISKTGGNQCSEKIIKKLGGD